MVQTHPPAAQYLAAAGIGTLSIADDDIVSLGNLHQQILFTPEDVGLSKVKTAVEKLRSQNPLIEVISYHQRVTSSNVMELIAGFDLVIEGTPNHYLLKWKFYKKMAIKVARRVKVGAGSKVTKFGFWGILVFVMLPVPGTGVYAGTIASYLFRMPYRQAFWANTIGIFLSCVIVWGMTLATYHGIN